MIAWIIYQVLHEIAIAQFAGNNSYEKLPPMVAEIGWSHNISQMRNYSQRYIGNQYQSAEMITMAKGLSKNVGTGLRIGGYTLGAYGFYNVNKEFLDGTLQYNGKPMSQQGLIMEISAMEFQHLEEQQELVG